MLLALDTATATASVAIYDVEKGQLLSEWTWQARRRQTQDLLATAQQMLQHAQLSPDRLTALAATTGPGSFTGVRIAISALKGIGMGLVQPPRIIGIPTLQVTVAPWWPLVFGGGEPFAACGYIQAGRGRFNWLVYANEQESASDDSTIVDAEMRPERVHHHAGTVQEFVDWLAQRAGQTLLVGESTVELRRLVDPLSHIVAVDNASGLRRAGVLAEVAACYLQRGVTDSLASLEPLYLRNP